MRPQKKNNSNKIEKVQEQVPSYVINTPTSLAQTNPEKTPSGYMTSQQFRTELKAELKDFYSKNGLL
jgi:hypothetical protein